MKQIRTSVFETNSSMSHSLVICENNEYSNWLVNMNCLDENESDNLYLYNPCEGKFMHYKKAIQCNIEELHKNLKKGWLNDEVTEKDIEEYSCGHKSLCELDEGAYNYWLTYDEFREVYDTFEMNVEHYTTKHGDKLELICYYGADY